MQQYGGQPVLTWWQGHIPPQGFGEGEEIIDNSSYQQIGRVHAGNGYKADLHDFHITPQGTALLTVFDPIDCNLSSLGGPERRRGDRQHLPGNRPARRASCAGNGTASTTSASRTPTARPTSSSTDWPFDYFHLNSIDQLANGTTLISARNTSALYELNTLTGQVLDAHRRQALERQALARGRDRLSSTTPTVLANGTISIFDNGGVPKVHSQSRALVVAIDAHDEDRHACVAQYEHPSPPLSSGSQGNVQPLENGDVFIGWGSEPYFSEFSAGGQLLYDAHLHGSYQSYRTYRFPWTGAPSEPAGDRRLPPAGGRGDRLRELERRHPDGQLARARRTDRRSSSRPWPAPRATASRRRSPRPARRRYVAVQALDASGAVLGTSRTIAG